MDIIFKSIGDSLFSEDFKDNGVVDDENKSSSVESWNREEIEHSEIYANDSRKDDEK